VQIHLADPFEAAHEERILAQQFPGTATLDMALGEAGIGLLHQLHQLGGELDLLFEGPLLQSQQPLIPAAQAPLVQDALNGDAGDGHPFQRQLSREEVAATGGM
jgi:hypothetical protein